MREAGKVSVEGAGMRGTNWIRLVLCGFVAGVVSYLVTAVFLFLFAPDFVASVQRSAPYSRYSRWGGEFFFGVDIVMGIWAIWLYSAIAPRYGARPTTAAIAGVAWWTIKSLQSAKWAGLGFVPPGVVVLIALAAMSLIAAVVASAVGAWLYDRVDRPAATGVPAT